jgi:hypothetical protein
MKNLNELDNKNKPIKQSTVDTVNKTCTEMMKVLKRAKERRENIGNSSKK